MSAVTERRHDISLNNLAIRFPLKVGQMRKLSRIRRALLALSLIGVVLGPAALIDGVAHASSGSILFFGSQSGSCGGSFYVVTNAYGYPVSNVTTPGYGYSTCYATDAQVFWGPGYYADSGQQGASATAVGPQGSTATYGQFLGCPGIFNCSGWSGLIPA